MSSLATSSSHDVSLARRTLLAALGVAIGTYSTLCGIGGWIFAVPLLHYAYGMELKAAVANSLVLVAASTTAATLSEIVHPDSALRLSVLVVLVPASLVGTEIGYAVAKRTSAATLKLAFCLALCLAGVRIFFAPAAPGHAAEVSILQHVEVAAVGLAAGFSAPMLGIGGGLVAVPGLVLGLPGLGYASARACSTAMSVANSVRSVWLYARDGRIRPGIAAWFAGGGVLGGVLGDLLIHVPAVVALAQRMLGVTLVAVAVRFAWDLWSSRSRTKR